MGAPVRSSRSYVSPYVAESPGRPRPEGHCVHEIDPIIPFMGNDESRSSARSAVSPRLHRRPRHAHRFHGHLRVPDDRHPSPAVRPTDPVERASRPLARWSSPTRGMGEVFIWRLFNQVMINLFVGRADGSRDPSTAPLQEDIPHVLDYLEAEVPKDAFLLARPRRPTCRSRRFFLRRRVRTRHRIDAARWSRTAAFVGSRPRDGELPEARVLRRHRMMRAACRRSSARRSAAIGATAHRSHCSAPRSAPRLDEDLKCRSPDGPPLTVIIPAAHPWPAVARASTRRAADRNAVGGESDRSSRGWRTIARRGSARGRPFRERTRLWCRPTDAAIEVD